MRLDFLVEAYDKSVADLAASAKQRKMKKSAYLDAQAALRAKLVADILGTYEANVVSTPRYYENLVYTLYKTAMASGEGVQRAIVRLREQERLFNNDMDHTGAFDETMLHVWVNRINEMLIVQKLMSGMGLDPFVPETMTAMIDRFTRPLTHKGANGSSTSGTRSAG